MSGAARGATPGHIILCGLGHVGYRVLCLLGRLGERVTVVSAGGHDDWLESARSMGRVIVGDARSDAVLRDAGVAEARAVIASTDDDMTNVSIALDAHRLNPRAAIVIRLFDQELAARIEGPLGLRRALSASALAAPAFAAAALGGTVQATFECGGCAFVIEETGVGGAADAARLEGDCACAVVGTSGGATTVLRQTPAAPVASAVPARAVGGASALAAAVRNSWREAPRTLRVVVWALLAVVAASMLVFHVSLGLPMVDSLYFVMTIVTTTGFGDYNLMQAPPALKLFGAFLMLCGAALIAVLFSIVTDILLRSRLRDLLSHGCSGRSGHIIVAGLGNVGFRVVRELVRNGERVVCIELDARGPFVEPAKSLGPVISGDAAREETLARAGLAGAKAVVAATNNDIVNLGVAVTAKRVNPGARVVVRAPDETLAAKMQHSLGVERVLSVADAAAPTAVAVALCADALHGLVLRDSLMVLYHRPAGDDGGVGAAGDMALFSRGAGAARFVALAPGSPVPAPGDEVIGVRSIRFADGAGA